jgi:uncharacterized protein YukE
VGEPRGGWAGGRERLPPHAQTWRNVAANLRQDTDRLAGAAQLDLTEWTGAAADAYRRWVHDQEQSLEALATAADTMAAITEGAGFLIAAVRVLVRDAIATLVSRLVVYAAEEAASFGLATPLVVEQVSTLVASWAAKIARWLKSLVSSLRALTEQSRVLERLIKALKNLLGKLHKSGEGSGGGPTPTPPGRFDHLSDHELIADRGAKVGRPGSGARVREVESESDLKDFFSALSRNGAVDITPPGFNGKMIKLPDGTIVNWRTKSRSTGSTPTVDVRPFNGVESNFKVHINPHGW